MGNDMERVDPSPLRHPELPGWYSPPRLLALFFFISLLQFLDQGTLASNGVTGEGQGVVELFGLTPFQAGWLPAAYTIGFLLAAFVFSELAKSRPAFRVAGIGSLIWIIAVALTGASFSYWFLLLARCMAGFGEASVVTLSFPFVDDCAPTKWKSTYFAILALAQALGTAAGFVYGGAVSDALGWRVCFWIIAGAGSPLVAILLYAPPVKLRHTVTVYTGHGHEAPAGHAAPLAGRLLHNIKEGYRDVRELARHPAWLLNNFGNVGMWATTAVLGFWGTKAAVDVYDLTQDAADSIIGLIIVIAAVLGTLGGGLLFDRLGTTLRVGFALMAVSSAAGLLALLGSFWLPLAGGSTAGLVLLGVGLVALFCYQSASFALSMWTAPLRLRPVSQATLALSHYVLGDLPAPPATGAMYSALQPSLGSNAWATTLCIVCGFYLLTSASLYVGGYALARSSRARDFRDSDGDGLLSEDERASGPGDDVAMKEGAGSSALAPRHDSVELIVERGGLAGVTAQGLAQ